MSSSAAAAAASAVMPPEYTAAVESYRTLQGEMTTLVSKQQQLEMQLHENTMVKEEFDTLKGEEHVYKLYGRVLVREDPAEAKGTIEGRLKFIKGEMTKTERAIKEAQSKMDAQRNLIIEMQKKLASKQARS